MDAEPPQPLREGRVEFIAGMLAQMTWGDEKRTVAQRERSIEVAREALEKLRS